MNEEFLRGAFWVLFLCISKIRKSLLVPDLVSDFHGRLQGAAEGGQSLV